MTTADTVSLIVSLRVFICRPRCELPKRRQPACWGPHDGPQASRGGGSRYLRAEEGMGEGSGQAGGRQAGAALVGLHQRGAGRSFVPGGERVLNPQARRPHVVWSGSERHRMCLHLVMIIMVCV